MKSYVLGFMFNHTMSSVVLLRKQKPDWQRGLLNGVGGKIEDGETPESAMVREFKEEAGVGSTATDWRHYCSMTGKNFEVLCFVSRNTRLHDAAHTVEEEVLEKHTPRQMNLCECVSNLPWLIFMAMDENYGKPFMARVHYQ